MKVKVIRPRSPLIILQLVMILVVLALGIVANIYAFSAHEMNWLPIVASIASIFLIGYFGFMFVSTISKKITLEEKNIYVSKDGFGLRVIQYEEKVEYTDISDIYIMISSNDSRGKSVAGLVTPMRYLVLESKDRQSHAINVYYYTEKQVIGMIDEIIKRAKSQGNTIECESGQKIFDKLKEIVRGR